MASTYENKKAMVRAFAEFVKSRKYRVYLAEKQTYGYYTDDAGSRVVCFQEGCGMIDLSGNYVTDKPKECGTGWKIYEEICPTSIEISQEGSTVYSFRGQSHTVHAAFNARPPGWALKNCTEWSYASQAVHQSRYQNSSRYEEI